MSVIFNLKNVKRVHKFELAYQALADAIKYILLTVSQDTLLLNYIRSHLLAANTFLGVSYFCLRPLDNDYIYGIRLEQQTHHEVDNSNRPAIQPPNHGRLLIRTTIRLSRGGHTKFTGVLVKPYMGLKRDFGIS